MIEHWEAGRQEECTLVGSPVTLPMSECIQRSHVSPFFDVRAIGRPEDMEEMEESVSPGS